MDKVNKINQISLTPLKSKHCVDNNLFNFELDEVVYSDVKINNKIHSNDKYEKFGIEVKCNGYMTIAMNVSNEELERASKKHLSYETYDDYLKNVKDYAIKSDKQWVYNYIDNIDDHSDKIIYQDNFFILLPDMKWSNFSDIINTYCLAIVKQKDLLSIRDLTSDHITLLEHILHTGLCIIHDKFNIDNSLIRTYLHYHPSTWHLHVHFTHISCKNANCLVDYSHELNSVIENLKLDGNYYQKIKLRI